MGFQALEVCLICIQGAEFGSSGRIVQALSSTISSAPRKCSLLKDKGPGTSLYLQISNVISKGNHITKIRMNTDNQKLKKDH